MSENTKVAWRIMNEYSGAQIQPDELLEDYFDSLDIAQIKVEIEEYLEIEIPDDRVFETAQDLINYIESGERNDVAKNTK